MVRALMVFSIGGDFDAGAWCLVEGAAIRRESSRMGSMNASVIVAEVGR